MATELSIPYFYNFTSIVMVDDTVYPIAIYIQLYFVLLWLYQFGLVINVI